MKQIKPDYKLIFSDIIDKEYPEKREKCQSFLDKDFLSALDIIKLNSLLFEIKDNKKNNLSQKHRSYKKSDVLQIIYYQKKFKLNNSQLAKKFNLSRNTVTKWKKIYS
ncbi:helix-turn-helix domain-containing protein [Chryseobacterium sp. EO14]|uniref:helix-turn-helix domain-containing protein n=1 Tax=Chryseobacterium sp. EO14 TaxID=2950551 RepID=UPI00210AC0EC|nr:helix-turn-helix domain-containing protein [Chryseobacterium sp. EO14]MCQ4142437.1 helix-turn-helix domain-containing protein [Chryseobacterium sp. EO14]